MKNRIPYKTENLLDSQTDISDTSFFISSSSVLDENKSCNLTKYKSLQKDSSVLWRLFSQPPLETSVHGFLQKVQITVSGSGF
jgi:hypothetical protein